MVDNAPPAPPPGFNPRPPLLAGESRMAANGCMAPTFQSAPAIAGGRIDPRRLLGFVLSVSIRARHCWRANRSSQARRIDSNGFNPRPPLLAGESDQPMMRHTSISVSIRARHCWRANPTCRLRSWRGCWFQSAPAIAGGRIVQSGAHRLGRGVSIRARHCWRANLNHPRQRADPLGFNPRPPLLAGESVRGLPVD